MRGFVSEAGGAIHGCIMTVRLSPVSISATSSRPRAFAEILMRTRASGCVAVIGRPDFRSSSSRALPQVDKSAGVMDDRFCNSSEAVGWRGSSEEIRAASCAAASGGLCACPIATVTHPDNSANATRVIGLIIRVAGNQPDYKPQRHERYDQRARDAADQAQSRHREVTRQTHGGHWRPPAATVATVSDVSWPSTLAKSTFA